MIACIPAHTLSILFAGPTANLLSMTGWIWWVLVAVALKVALYKYFDKTMSWPRIIAFTIIANIVSTIAALLISAFSFAMPGFFSFLGCLFIGPVKRFINIRMPQASKGTSACIRIACGFLLFFSVILWAVSPESIILYWITKVLYVFLALSVSLFSTVLWEEWVFNRLKGKQDKRPDFYEPLIRTNLVNALILFTFAAAFAIPQRLARKDFMLPDRSSLHHNVRALPLYALEHR